MKALTEILPDVFVIEVPTDAEDINIKYQFLYYFLNYASTVYGIALFGEFEILGTITKDEISFDVELYVKNEYHVSQKLNQQAHYDTFWINVDGKDKFFDTKGQGYKWAYEQSFRSLLLKHGLFWENPIKQPLRTNFRIKELSFSEEFNLFKNAHNAWQQQEANKLTGKLVVLKKVTP